MRAGTVGLGLARAPRHRSSARTAGAPVVTARRWPAWWPLAALTLLAGALRFSTLDLQSFWYDEAFTPVQVLHASLWPTLHSVVAKENTPPPGAGDPPAPGFRLRARLDVNGLIVYRFSSSTPRIVSERVLLSHAITLQHPEVLIPGRGGTSAGAP